MAEDRSSSPDPVSSRVLADGLTVGQLPVDPLIDEQSQVATSMIAARQVGGGPVERDQVEGEPDEVEPTSEERAEAKRKARNRTYVEWLIVIVVAMTSAFLVRAFVVQQFAVDGRSMMTTLHDGDRVLVNKLSYRLHDPNRGDVVVLKTIEGVGERDLIKRVVALPGETVSYESCVLRVDGKVLVEPYLDPTVVTPTSCGPSFGDTVIQPKHVFVMGDNRGGSKDSRDGQVGQIAYPDLVGRAFVVIWPLGDWRWL